MKNLGRTKVPEKAIGSGIQNRGGSWPFERRKPIISIKSKEISFRFLNYV